MTSKQVVKEDSNKELSAREARMVADAGKGVSTDASDKFVPLIKVLQPLSPQCLKSRPEYIEGAEAGDFFLRNTLTPLIKGGVGLEFQPCAFSRTWLEFDGPRENNPKFIGRYADDKGAPKGVTGLEKDGWGFTGKDNHRFVFIREHFGLVDGHPFVMPFTGSGHTTSKNWQTLMDQFTLRSGAVEPSFNRKYKLTTTSKSNSKGTWFAVNVAVLTGMVSDIEYDRGLALHEAVVSGLKQSEAPEPVGEEF